MSCTALEDIVMKMFQESGSIVFTRRSARDVLNVKSDTALANLVEEKDYEPLEHIQQP